MLLSRWLLACRASLLPTDGLPHTALMDGLTTCPNSCQPDFQDLPMTFFPLFSQYELQFRSNPSFQNTMSIPSSTVYLFFLCGVFSHSLLGYGGYLQSASLKALSKLVSHRIGALYNLNQDTNPARLDFRASSQPETIST